MKNCFLCFFLLVCMLSVSCQSVKPYEKIYLNDPDMSFSTRKTQQFESNFQTYREGSSGATGGKSGGGCGCN